MVRYKDSIVRVDDIKGHVERLIAEVSDHKGGHFEVPVNDLELGSMPLGNIQVDDYFGYFVRIPDRRWKQGLAEGHLNQIREDCHKPLRVRLLSNAIMKCVKGAYDSFQDALYNILDKGYEGCAFSRTFGLMLGDKGQIDLLYRGHRVGFITEVVKDDFELVLFKDKFYLKEELLETLNGVGE